MSGLENEGGMFLCSKESFSRSMGPGCKKKKKSEKMEGKKKIIYFFLVYYDTV